MSIGPIGELQADADIHHDAPRLPTKGASIARNGVLLSAGSGLIGVLSYVVTLIMANALAPADFSQFAAAQMMLGMVGTVTSALVPLPLAQAVVAHPPGSVERRDAMAFAALVSVLVGLLAALVTGIVAAGLGSALTAVFVALSAFVLFIGAAPSGWLQGELRFVRYTVKSVGEVVIRLVFSLVVALLAWGAAGAVLGFAMGGLALLVTPWAFFRDLTWRPKVLRQKWRWAETSDIAVTLCVISVLVGIDVVLVAFLDGGSDAAAGFQALASLAKAPVYVAAGTVLVVFPLLRRPGVDVPAVLADALRSFGQLALLACAVIATAPYALVALVMPARYSPSFALLPWLALSGLGYATLSVLATILLGVRAYRRCQLGLAASSLLVAAGLLIGWVWNGVPGLALGCAVGALTSAGVLTVIAWPLLPPGSGRMAAKGFAAAACLAVLLKLADHSVLLWLMAVALTGLVVLAGLNKKSRSDKPRRLRAGRSGPAAGQILQAVGRRRAVNASVEPAVRADTAPTKLGWPLGSLLVCIAVALGVRATMARISRSTLSK